ncbi:MAG: tyrosine-protein phosphatase [Coriobacteriales bacterium]|nr:tyrosine-protein phosphatase [Coriobacteriales bacterium]
MSENQEPMTPEPEPAATAAPALETLTGYIPGFRPRFNMRELGGYVGAGGRRVKRGVFYRCSALGEATPEELELIRHLGIAEVLDLRSSTEADALPDPPVPGASYVRISGAMSADDREIDMSPARIYSLLFNPRRVDDDPEPNLMSQVAEIYTSLAFHNPAYQHMFDQIEAGQVPILFHCTVGKDRTGIAAMLILLALGVDDETILADYNLTNDYRADVIQEKLDARPILSRVGLVETAARFMEGVLPEFGARVLDEIKQEHGDYATFFLKEYGLTPERIERLRAIYLE